MSNENEENYDNFEGGHDEYRNEDESDLWYIIKLTI
jgi:hypothetical protein